MKPTKNIITVLFSLLILWAMGFALFAGISLFGGPQKPSLKTDAIIVLTGGAMRIEEGLELFSKRQARHLFISGVFKDVVKSDITALSKSELPACCLTLGYKATTTQENAIETREWVDENDIDSIRLVTGNYHMVRSVIEFRHMLPGITIYAHPVMQPDLNLSSTRLWFLLLVEYHKTLYRTLQLLLT